MRKIFSVLLVSLLTSFSLAGDLAHSFKEAAALGDALEKERTTQAYIHLDLMPYFEKTDGPVFSSCMKSVERADLSPFSFVVAIGADGRVLRLYSDRETNILACARQTLQKGEFPHPPIAPYYMHISMSFSK